jgi:ferritin
MPMKYESQDEKISKYIKDLVIPAIKRKDLDYNQLVKKLCVELGVKEERVESVLKRFIDAGEMKEERILTITDDKIPDMLKLIKEEEEKLKSELKEAGINGG